jgi:hypothetical protein|uniref:DNA repair protein n=1 Tax=Myoviridae sp. ctshb19 TaxID=2825194 RepID=A0A8S5UGT0_9CAUD|nr:MAG TPA: DNA repair protein [Myoviridae sp. ctshb19]
MAYVRKRGTRKQSRAKKAYDKRTEQPEGTVKMSRSDITSALMQALTFYYAKKTCSVHKEVGVVPWGRSRLDALVIDYPGNFMGVEIKSCLADYRADKKWRDYLPHTNKLYFLFAPSITKSRCYPEIREELRAEGVGILVLSETTGLITCSQKAKYRQVAVTAKYRMFRKLAWLAGEAKHNIKRTQRVFLT